MKTRLINQGRREMLKQTSAALAAGATAPFFLGCSSLTAPPSATRGEPAVSASLREGAVNQRRIDTHCHVIPPEYSDWLHSQPSYPGPFLAWSKDAALESFELNDVETGILSVSTPGVWLGPSTDMHKSRALARDVNEFCAKIVSDDPGRFGFFATLTLPDLGAAINEAAYALDHLHADGVVLMSNVGGVYVGAPEWDPLLEFLNERKTVLFVHPTALPSSLVPGISAALTDFLADTTRAAVNLVKHDCLTRYPDLRIILSHGGGYVPYAALRIASMLSPQRSEETVLEQLRRFYFDTALTPGPYALPSLLAFADPSRITYGSDWPYAPLKLAHEFTLRLDAYPLTAVQRKSISRQNAERLFPRLADAGI